ncbi:hypothetical protein RSAG8_10864, partial [Rhizoctonia solani AG-8 WAC10335]
MVITPVADTWHYPIVAAGVGRPHHLLAGRWATVYSHDGTNRMARATKLHQIRSPRLHPIRTINRPG